MRKSPKKHTVTRRTKSGNVVTYTRGNGAATNIKMPLKREYKSFHLKDLDLIYTNMDIPEKGVHAVNVVIDNKGDFHEVTDELRFAAERLAKDLNAKPYAGQQEAHKRNIAASKLAYEQAEISDKKTKNFSNGLVSRRRIKGNVTRNK